MRPNFGAMYVMLDDFHHRAQPDLSGRRDRRRAAEQAAGRNQRRAGQRLRRPAVEGLGTAGGFKIMIEDRGDTGLEALQNRRPTTSSPTGAEDARPRKACSPASAPTRPGSISTSTATQAKPMGVSMADVFNTLQVYSARCTSTTSTASAAPGRSTCRPTPTSASRSTTSSS